RVPLSYAQQRLWFIDQLEGGTSEYNIPSALRLRGRLDREAVARAIQAIVERHESLRTHFADIEGEPAQVIEPALAVPVPVVDLSGTSEAVRTAAVRAAASSEWSDAFDLSRGPVVRARLLKLDEQDHVLLTTLHHIVSDGWSS